MALPNIEERDEIAEEAQRRIDRVFVSNGWGKAPKITSGLVTEVLRATEQVTGCEVVPSDQTPVDAT